jgi:MFS family permease
VTIDGTAALAASALLRAAVARTAREEAAGEESNGDDPGEQAERRANAAINVAFSVTMVLGPAIASVLVAAAGAASALFVDVASFLICGAMLLDVRAHVEEAGVSVRKRLQAAWQHISAASSLRRLLLAQAIALVFFESAAPIEVAYAKATLHAGDHGYGLLLGVWGLGAVAGSVVFAKSLHRSLTALLSAGTLGVGLAYLGWAAAPSLAAACGAAVLGGVGNGVQWAALISGVQRLTPGGLQGRLMGAVESIGAICPVIGLSLGGALVAASSPRGAFLVVGVGGSAMTAAFATVRFGGRSRDRERVPHGGVSPSPAPPAQMSDALPQEGRAFPE